MIFSAAGGKTAFQLSQLLRTNMTSTRIEAAYNAAFQAVNCMYIFQTVLRNFINWFSVFSAQSESVKSTVLNVGATDLREKFEAPFLNHFQSVFKLRWFSEDTTDKEKAARKINRWAAAATNQRITEIVRSGKWLYFLSLLFFNSACFKYFRSISRWLWRAQNPPSECDVFQRPVATTVQHHRNRTWRVQRRKRPDNCQGCAHDANARDP